MENKISRLERKSPDLGPVHLNCPWRWPPALERPWPQDFPVTSVEFPPLASGPFLHPESSGSLWSTGWGDWARNWRPRPVDTRGGGLKPCWKPTDKQTNKPLCWYEIWTLYINIMSIKRAHAVTLWDVYLASWRSRICSFKPLECLCIKKESGED